MPGRSRALVFPRLELGQLMPGKYRNQRDQSRARRKHHKFDRIVLRTVRKVPCHIEPSSPVGRDNASCQVWFQSAHGGSLHVSAPSKLLLIAPLSCSSSSLCGRADPPLKSPCGGDRRHIGAGDARGDGSRRREVTQHLDAEMATHKFRVGEKVQYLAGAAVRFATAEVYEIVQQLPESDGEYQYKIKSADDPHLRVAKESQLRRA